MGTDTIHFNIEGFALSDIYAMPKKGFLIDYKDGRWQINRAAGHVHFYWIKSGWLFRTGAAGYAAFDLANGVIRNDYTFKGSGLGIAAGVFALGVFLKIIYTPTLRTGKKYHFTIFKVADSTVFHISPKEYIFMPGLKTWNYVFKCYDFGITGKDYT